MPSKSKQQQKFMGIVRSIQKGEAPAGKFSKAAQKAAKSMEKGSVRKYAKTKHDDLPKKVKEERDYKDEYKKFQSSTKSKKYRAELNKYNRKKGTYGNGDGKDASHKGGKIVGFESESKNRGRAEKSRLKKESQITELVPPMSVTNPAAYKAMLDRQISKNVKVKTALGNRNHKDHKKAKSLFQRFMAKFKKKKKDEGFGGDLKGSEKKKFEKARKENAEVLGYKLTGKGDVNEGQKQYAQKLTDDFMKSVRKFEQEVIVLAKMSTKIRGDKTDEKIILKMYKKHMTPFISLISSWNSGTQRNPQISESVNEAKDPDIIAKIRDVLKNGITNIKDPVSGKKMKVDSYSASAITQVYDKINTSNKKKFANLSIPKMAKMAMKFVK